MQLTGKLRKYVPVEGEEKTYHLRYNYNALILLEEALGMGIVEFGDRLRQRQLRFRDIRSLIWAGLVGENEQMTMQAAGLVIDEVGLQPIVTAAMEAFFAAFPSLQKDESRGEEQQGNRVELSGTGKVSSEAQHKPG